MLRDVQAAERQKAGCWLAGGDCSHWGAGSDVSPWHPKVPVPLVIDTHLGPQRGSRATSGVMGPPNSGSFCRRSCGS